MATIVFGLAALLVISTASGQETTTQFVDFEQFSGPSVFTSAQPPLTVGEATFSGGQVLSGTTFLPTNPTNVYGTAFFCSMCLPEITIDFSSPASNISLQVMNGLTTTVTYTIEDDKGGTVTATLPSNLSGGEATINLASTDVSQVTIRGGSASVFDFFIDSISFAIMGEEFRVSFTAFIPSDNVKGPRLASCIFGVMPPEIRQLFFKGDDRSFDPAADTFRLRQRVTVVAEETIDPDGLKEGTIQHLVAESRSYAEDAMDDGVIDEDDEDGIANDCTLFQEAATAGPDNMVVVVLRNSPSEVFVRMEGGPGMPLSRLAEVFSRVDWLMTLTIDTATGTPEWRLAGRHDGFPAYEIHINDMEIYRYSPGTPPLTFRDHANKLLGPMDVTVDTSGTLP